nr:UDP-glucosyltransferase 2 [Helicoverpa armigera]WRX06237.1 UGT43A1 [Helicoverpa armigera]
MKLFILFTFYCIFKCECYKILAIFPYDGRSHHIYFTALVEELALRKHNVTVINYHPVPALPTLRQISLQEAKENTSDNVNIEEHLKVLSTSNFLSVAYGGAQVFKQMANTNCKKLVNNKEIRELIESKESFDIVIAEQFVTDCGLAVAYKLNAPVIGMTAHILMSWTYSRLGAPNHPAYVPNHFFASGNYPNLWNRIKSTIINFGMNMYYAHVIQKQNQEIVNAVYPDIPPLEELGKNVSLILINQYFPLTGSRLQGSNVVEVGGMHIKENAQIEDKGLKNFLDNAKKDVVFISFGSVAKNFPQKILDEIKNLIKNNSDILFIWKLDASNWEPPTNAYVDKWMSQKAILCHPKVVAFITHSGMLSSSEAMYCGVPIVGVPLFGDQFANAQSAVESGLGVAVDILSFNEKVLKDALKTILQEEYRQKAKLLSQQWKDRPLSPMNTAIFWIEYVAKYKGVDNLKPSAADLPMYQYLMIDVILVLGSVFLLLPFAIVKLIFLIVRKKSIQKSQKKEKRKKRD